MLRLIVLFFALSLVITVSAQDALFEPHVIFESREGERQGVYVADVEQLEVHPLIERNNNVQCAIVSPDRQYIVYNVAVDSPTGIQGHQLHYYVYRINDGIEYLIAELNYVSYTKCFIEWSPDSQWIKFDYQYGYSLDISTYIARVDGTSLTEISQSYQPYIGWDIQSEALYILKYYGILEKIDLNTMETSIVFDFDVSYVRSAWASPTDSQIYVAHDSSRDTIELDYYDLVTNQSYSIGEFEWPIQLAFSSDNRRLAIVEYDNVYVREEQRLWQVVFDTPVRVSNPIWSPDNNTLILEYHDRSDPETLDNWLVSIGVEYGVFEELNFLRHGFNPVFVADGDWVVFHRRNNEHTALLYRMRPNGSDISPIPQSTITPYDSLNDSWGAYNVQAYFP